VARSYETLLPLASESKSKITLLSFEAGHILASFSNHKHMCVCEEMKVDSMSSSILQTDERLVSQTEGRACCLLGAA
jgi:hypothetical protein